MKFKKFMAILTSVSTLLIGGTANSVFALEMADTGTTIYLVRHGKTILNAANRVQGWIDSKLTEEGVAGAENVAVGLKDIKFEAVYSSDLGRAADTAEIIMSFNDKTVNKAVSKLRDLRETNYGVFEGDLNMNMAGAIMDELGIKTMEEFSALPNSLQTMLNTGSRIDKTGEYESYDELRTRLMRGFMHIVDASNGGNVLVVAHGNAINVILSELGKEGFTDIANSSVSKIIYKDGKFTIDAFNDLNYRDVGEQVRMNNDGRLIPNYESNTIPDYNKIGKAPEKVTVYLIRHGKTILNTADRVQGWSDSPLTDAGVQVAVETGVGLANVEFTRAFSSDLGRTVETTDLILGQSKTTAKDIPYIKLSDLRETNYGKYEADFNSVMWGDIVKEAGVPDITQLKDIGLAFEAMDKVAANDATGQFETHDVTMERVVKGFYELCEYSAYSGGGNVLVVMHGGVISGLLRTMGVDVADVPNASVSKIIYDDGQYTIETYADMSYYEAGKLITPYRTSGSGINYKTAASLRQEAEKIGATVDWSPKYKTATVTLNGNQIEFKVGSNVYYLNGKIGFMTEGISYIYNGRTYLDPKYLEALKQN